MNHNAGSKTLGPRSARLVTELQERGRTIFSIAEVVEILELRPRAARNLVASLVNRGVVTRLKPGLFILVPYEMGWAREYLGDPFVVARELAGGADYFISHASAMALHGMTTQPQLVVYTTAPRSIRRRVVLDTEFRFVRCKRDHLFGLTGQWVTKTEKVQVSDMARTVIDCLKQPEHCGGITEAAKGLWMRWDDIDPGKLIRYATRLNVGAVTRRLGFLLELFGADAPREIELLRIGLSRSYALLDPLLPAEGKFLARWRLRLNVSPEEIRSVVET